MREERGETRERCVTNGTRRGRDGGETCVTLMDLDNGHAPRASGARFYVACTCSCRRSQPERMATYREAALEGAGARHNRRRAPLRAKSRATREALAGAEHIHFAAMLTHNWRTVGARSRG